MFSADYTEASDGKVGECPGTSILKQCLDVRTVCRMKVFKIGAALKCESLYKISRKTPTAEAQLLAFTIFTAIRKHSGQPRAMRFGGLKFLPITEGRC